MPLISIVVAAIPRGWLFAFVIAFMIVAYTSFFGRDRGSSALIDFE